MSTEKSVYVNSNKKGKNKEEVDEYPKSTCDNPGVQNDCVIRSRSLCCASGKLDILDKDRWNERGRFHIPTTNLGDIIFHSYNISQYP